MFVILSRMFFVDKTLYIKKTQIGTWWGTAASVCVKKPCVRPPGIIIPDSPPRSAEAANMLKLIVSSPWRKHLGSGIPTS